MASATLNSLVGTSKPAVTNGGGIAAALLGAAGGASPAGSASPSATGTGAAPAASGPATIGDFLAMLSGMLDTPEGASAAANGAAAGVASDSNVIKSDSAKPDATGDMSQLYAQLLALMQGGSTDATAAQAAAASAVAAATDSAGAATAAGVGAAATSTAQNPLAAAAQDAAAGTDAAQNAAQAAAAGQRDLIAKLLGQPNAGDGAHDAGDANGSATEDSKSFSSLLQNDLKSLLAGGTTSGDSASGVSLKDLSALIAQATAGNAAAPTTQGSQPDPSLMQAAAANAAGAPPPAPAASAANAAAGNGSLAHGHLGAPVGTAAWTEQLGTHLTWMAGSDQQSASLKLTPPHLGPLEVQITVSDDNKASINFSAPHADTRAALGEALPRLREMFGASGLTLADANVSREPSRQKPRSQANPDNAVGKVGGVADDSASSASARLAAIHAGILDTYA